MDFLKKIGVKKTNFGASTGLEWNTTKDQGELKIYSPADGKFIASVYQASIEDYDKVVKKAHEAYLEWRNIPAPKRGEIVRQIGDKLRKYKDPLGHLVSYEMGKSLQEGLGLSIIEALAMKKAEVNDYQSKSTNSRRWIILTFTGRKY